jgi:hypothetical protein
MFSFAHDIRCDSNIIGNASPDQILPSDFARCMLERVNMTLPARIRPNENQIACDKRVAVETCLIAVLFDVVAPVDTPSVAIQGIEIPELGSDKQQLTHNCGRGEHSTVCIKLPANRRIRLECIYAAESDHEQRDW